MNYHITDLRRFFRNRFESYITSDDTSGAYVNDGVPLTLRDICLMLEGDTELFPRNYDPDIRKLCGHEYLIWFREERTYGNVAGLMNKILDCRDVGRLRPVGRWVSAVINDRIFKPK